MLYLWFLCFHRVAPFFCSLAPQDVGRQLLFEFLPGIWVFRSKNGQIPPPLLSTKWRICSHKALIQVRSLFFLLVLTSLYVAKPCIMSSEWELFSKPIFNTYQNHIWIKLYLILSVFYEMFLLTCHMTFLFVQVQGLTVSMAAHKQGYSKSSC